MNKITVNASSSYDIFIDSNILDNCGQYLKNITKTNTVAIITDDNVDKLYSSVITKSLISSGYTVYKFVFKHGEKQKSYNTLLDIYNFLANNHLTRTDCLIALGGGVVGDITGFAAATYLRGVDFIQIPTTLLAQVDSSVGGKTAIDLPSGKNLVGAFKQPKLVICDTNTLNTLDDEYFTDGMGEVIKYGMIKSAELFNKLSENKINKNSEILPEIISQCINIKKEVVENDEFDTGNRMILNFGHTLGHAIEKEGNYVGISHGKAVGIGMALMTKICEKSGYCDNNTYVKLIECLKKYNIPYNTDCTVSSLINSSLNDKKRSGDSTNIIICTEIGQSKVLKLPIEEYKTLIRRLDNGC